MDRNLENPVIDPESFDAIAKLAYEESGLQLVAEKMSMIQSRLRHRLKAAGAADFAIYAKLVCSDEGIVERRQMISALTTNVSHFFRERHHFDILAKEIMPAAIEKLRSGGRFRIWSAGCSNGQEAYSAIMTLLEAFPELAELDIKVLATDIDPNVVEFATKGTYPERLTTGISEPLLYKYFDQQTVGAEKRFTAKRSLKSKAVFKELNLLSNWPMKQEMDVIFCRNVVIYFDVETQNCLWPRFNKQLASDGYLFLGHSERILDPKAVGFFNDGPTCYRHYRQHKTQAGMRK